MRLSCAVAAADMRGICGLNNQQTMWFLICQKLFYFSKRGRKETTKRCVEIGRKHLDKLKRCAEKTSIYCMFGPVSLHAIFQLRMQEHKHWLSLTISLLLSTEICTHIIRHTMQAYLHRQWDTEMDQSGSNRHHCCWYSSSSLVRMVTTMVIMATASMSA